MKINNRPVLNLNEAQQGFGGSEGGLGAVKGGLGAVKGSGGGGTPAKPTLFPLQTTLQTVKWIYYVNADRCKILDNSYE